jgi:pilus assembly protein CpaF
VFGRRQGPPEKKAPPPPPAQEPPADDVDVAEEEKPQLTLVDSEDSEPDNASVPEPEAGSSLAPEPEPEEESELPPPPEPKPEVAAAPEPEPEPEMEIAPVQKKTRVGQRLESKSDKKKKDDEPAEMTPEEEARYNETKVSIFNTLIESVDLTELSKMPSGAVREEISDVVSEIVSMKALILSATEQQRLIMDICNDILGLGPLEPLLERDDIADIMVNGPSKVYIETSGKITLTNIKFRDNAQLMNICQRIVSAVGRRVDESSPICDARLLDGSRVNVIAPPLAIDGAALTIRKFKKDKLTLQDLVNFKSISPAGADVIKLVGGCRMNVMVSGGTGSGKTTLLNCLTAFIEAGERVITCEDSAELQLHVPHVVRLETRPPNLEGIGEVSMTDLVKNCLRMRPERIIVGEVRGKEAFDLLQAMNTGHDGSMGTIHANNPRECISRIENMIAMGGYSLPAKTVREQIAGAVNVIVQAARLRDGSRKITHVTEVLGMEGDVITLQDILVFDFEGETPDGKIIGRHKYTGLRPNFYDRVRYFGREQELATALQTLANEEPS